MSVVLTSRDLEILKIASRVGFLTETHICALFYSKHTGFELDLTKARNTLARRIMKLLNSGYLAKTTIPCTGPRNRVAYLLGTAGAEVLKNNREIEARNNSRWLQRRSNGILIRARHDLVTTNFLVNVMMLDRLVPDFHLVDWIPDRDCRFYIPHGEKKLVVNPDLYLSVRNGSPEGPTLFLEVDADTLDAKALRIKVLRLFQYFESRRYKTDLSIPRFPRICFIAPTEARLEAITSSIANSKKNYNGPSAETVMQIPFWLATYDQVEANSIDQGFVSRMPLESVWVNEAGDAFPSPMLP